MGKNTSISLGEHFSAFIEMEGPGLVDGDAVLGRALYNGAINPEEALKVAA